MKTIAKHSILLVLLVISTLSCSKDDDNTTAENNNLKTRTLLTRSETPAEIITYASTKFPSKSIELVIKETENNNVSYDVFLSKNIEIEFNGATEITSIESLTQLPDNAIPDAIRTFVTQNYPNNYIVSWELDEDDNQQEVTLNNGIELEFNLNGNHTGTDTDDDNNNNDDNEVVITEENIPVEIKNYINTHFTSNTIVKAVADTENNVVTYEIILNNNTELTFNNSSKIIEIESNIQLPNSTIQQALLDYVNQNYATNFITDWELKATTQEIELNTGTELIFSLDGAFVSDENNNNSNGNDSEVVLTGHAIPEQITNYINTHFPSNTLLETIKDTDNGVVTYEATLNGNIELTFNSNYAIIEIDSNTQLPNSTLQQAILNYVAQNYPNNHIVSWELENNEQDVELNNDVELVFDVNGTFLRVDN